MTTTKPNTLAPLGGAQAWRGTAPANWHHRVDPMAAAEIERALERFDPAAWTRADATTLPLPALTPLLAEISERLETGPGIQLVSGLPVAGKSVDALRALFLAIGRGLGTPLNQNRAGELMADITDEGATRLEERGKIRTAEGETFLASRARVHSSGGLRYHTDRCDVTALLCIRPAAEGGVNRLASAIAVHDEMARRRPDLARLLYQDIYRSRLGEEVGDNAEYYALPVFAHWRGHFTTHYSRTYVEAAQLNPEVPKMSPAQWEALDLLASLADEVAFEWRLEPGDVLFLNNHVVYHAREPYEDSDESGRERLLLRLWLSVPNSRPLPDGHGVLFGDVRAGAIRGGIAKAEPA